MNLDFLERQEDRISMKKLIGNDWDEVLEPVFESEKYQELRNFLKEEYQEINSELLSEYTYKKWINDILK